MLHSDASARTLAFMRLWIFGIWIVRLVIDPFQEIGFLSPDLFVPRGILALIPSAGWEMLLTPGALLALRLTLVFLCALALLGLRAYHLSAGIAAFLLVFYQGIIRGFGGHLNHQELAFLYVTLLIAVLPATDAFRWRRAPAPVRPRSIYAAGAITICLVICMTYVFVGTARVFESGVLSFDSDAMRRWVIAHSLRDSFWGFSIGDRLLDHALFDVVLKWSFPAVTVLEIVSPLALVFRRFRAVWVVSILSFHIGVWILMNIFFIENMLLMAFFTPLERWLPGRLAPQPRPPSAS